MAASGKDFPYLSVLHLGGQPVCVFKDKLKTRKNVLKLPCAVVSGEFLVLLTGCSLIDKDLCPS